MADTLISDNDLKYVRAEALRTLIDVCDIYQRTDTPDTTGGFTQEWDLTHADVKCRLTPARPGMERTADGRSVAESQWIVTLPYDQALDEKMRVTHQGVTYEVVFVNDAKSFDTARRATLKRRDDN